MDFNRSPLPITKVIASKGLYLCSTWEHVSQIAQMKEVLLPKFNYAPIPLASLLKVKNYMLVCFYLRKKKLKLQFAGCTSIISRILSSSGFVYDWGSMAGTLCCLLKLCYPTASAESVSAVLMLCQGETPGHRLLHQPFLLFDRTMNTSKRKTGKVREEIESIKRKRLFISTA